MQASLLDQESWEETVPKERKKKKYFNHGFQQVTSGPRRSPREAQCLVKWVPRWDCGSLGSRPQEGPRSCFPVQSWVIVINSYLLRAKEAAGCKEKILWTMFKSLRLSVCETMMQWTADSQGRCEV